MKFGAVGKLAFTAFAILIVSLCITGVALGASVKKAKKYEASEQLDQAFNEVIAVLQKKPGDEDARAYLLSLFPKIMERHLGILKTLLNNHDWENSCLEYRAVSGLTKKGKNFGVNVSAYEVDEDKMTNVCTQAAEKVYQKGRIEFDKGQTQDALRLFQQVLQFMNPYKDTDEMIQQCQAYH